jgi:heme/copper-type cytochrome/quinol oxidase subunit 2
MMRKLPVLAGCSPRRVATSLLACVLLLTLPSEASASLLSPELEDKLATFLALFVIFVVPVVLIVLFWLVHILPEKTAHNRQHPQFEAIRTLCLLSLVFGGLLWPLAWIWAYTKPVLHKMAYGTDIAPSDHGPAEPALAASSLQARVAQLEGRVPASDLAVLQDDLAAIEARYKAEAR